MWRWNEETIVKTQKLPAPSNTRIKSETWDSITLTRDAVEGASFYQIEVDGSKFWYASSTNAFTKRRLLPETEHTFRVRDVRGNSVVCGLNSFNPKQNLNGMNLGT